MNDDQQPVRVVVELLSSAEVKRLEERDEELRRENAQIRREMEALRRSFYELLENIAASKQKK